MGMNIETTDWSTLSYEEKNRQLYHMLNRFLERGAIRKQQFEKSLHDLTEKMGMEGEND